MNKLFIAIICVSLVMVSGLSYAGSTAGAKSNADSVADSNSNAFVDDHSSNKSTVKNRQILNPGNTPFPGTNGFFTAPTPDSSFRQVKELIYFLTDDEDALAVNLTEGACKKLAAGGDVESNMQIVRASLQAAKADADNVRWIRISIRTPIFKDGKVVGVNKEKLTVAGFATAEADDGDTDSYQVLGTLAVKAIKAKLNHLQVTAEGAHRKVEASGWGIGFYTVGGSVSDGGGTSGLVGGGTGFASNETGPEDRPWIQANVGLSM